MERRTFLKRATHACGAVFGLLLGIPGVAYLLDPRNRPARNSSFKRVAKLSDLPEPSADGPAEPYRAFVRDVRRDAWTLYPVEEIGSVWLVRRPHNKVVAFTTICPHLSCSVNFESAEGRFICPCHKGTFHATPDDRLGQRLSEDELERPNPAPRGMDALEVKLIPIPKSGGDFHIEVKYVEFVPGLHEARPKV